MSSALRRVRVFGAALLGAVVLAGCGTSLPQRDAAPSSPPRDLTSVPDAVPRAEPKSRYGNPKSYVVFGERYYTMDSATGFVERGIASWYGKKFHGRRTSSGETYDMYAMTAAHKQLPLPTYVRVTNLNNGRSVVVRVNDRGPFHDGRVIDLSYTAALKLDMVRAGTAPVEVQALTPGGTAPSVPIARAGTIFVQAGAFSTSTNAANLSRDLSAHFSEPVGVSRAVVNGSEVHRVRVGPLDDAGAADNVVKALGRLGVPGARVVVE